MFYLSKILWFFATPSNLLASVVLLGLALMVWRPGRRLGAVLAATGAAALLVAGLSPLPNWVVLPLEQRFPTYQEDGPVTGVIVLGGSVQPEETRQRHQLAVNEAGERVIALAHLARQHPSARIVFSGGGGTLLQAEAPEADMVARFAATLGVEPERITFENRSRTTAENARYTRALVEPQPGERWLLVTSAWHMPRSIGSFRQAGFPATAYPVDFRTRGPGDRWRTFSSVSEGLRRLDMATREWAGLLGYRLAGYTDALFPAPGGSPPSSEPATVRR